MTQIELSTMNALCGGMRTLSEAMTSLVHLAPHYVQVTPSAWVNPNLVSSVAQIPDSQDANARGGRVNVVMNSGDVYETPYLKADEVVAKLVKNS